MGKKKKHQEESILPTIENNIPITKIVIKENKQIQTQKHIDKHSHPYAEFLETFNGKIVEVKDVLGDTYRGTCIGLKKEHLNIILETADDYVIIKNVHTIRMNKDETKI
jgi:small nuclear ribonucleoprotein (snRNP)-like protein